MIEEETEAPKGWYNPFNILKPVNAGARIQTHLDPVVGHLNHSQPPSHR